MNRDDMEAELYAMSDPWTWLAQNDIYEGEVPNRVVNALRDAIDYFSAQTPYHDAMILAVIKPFYAAYAKKGDDIPDSDLDDEQPKHITVSLGDIRRLRRLIYQMEHT